MPSAQPTNSAANSADGQPQFTAASFFADPLYISGFVVVFIAIIVWLVVRLKRNFYENDDSVKAASRRLNHCRRRDLSYGRETWQASSFSKDVSEWIKASAYRDIEERWLRKHSQSGAKSSPDPESLEVIIDDDCMTDDSMSMSESSGVAEEAVLPIEISPYCISDII